MPQPGVEVVGQPEANPENLRRVERAGEINEPTETPPQPYGKWRGGV
jgi:hypothetical protein